MMEEDAFFGETFVSLESEAEDAARSLNTFTEEMARNGRETERASSKYRVSTASISGQIGRSFEKLATDGGKLSDVLAGLGDSISRTAFRAATKPVTDHIAGGITNVINGLMGFADGGAFSQGRVMPFARGGVVTSPVTFPMRGGTGLMGEAGPEAIMPLARGPDGSLGVRMMGMPQMAPAPQAYYPAYPDYPTPPAPHTAAFAEHQPVMQAAPEAPEPFYTQVPTQPGMAAQSGTPGPTFASTRPELKPAAETASSQANKPSLPDHRFQPAEPAPGKSGGAPDHVVETTRTVAKPSTPPEHYYQNVSGPEARTTPEHRFQPASKREGSAKVEPYYQTATAQTEAAKPEHQFQPATGTSGSTKPKHHYAPVDQAGAAPKPEHRYEAARPVEAARPIEHRFTPVPSQQDGVAAHRVETVRQPVQRSAPPIPDHRVQISSRADGADLPEHSFTSNAAVRRAGDQSFTPPPTAQPTVTPAFYQPVVPGVAPRARALATPVPVAAPHAYFQPAPSAPMMDPARTGGAVQPSTTAPVPAPYYQAAPRVAAPVGQAPMPTAPMALPTPYFQPVTQPPLPQARVDAMEAPPQHRVNVTRSGDLRGDGPASAGQAINVVMNIQTQDAESFRRSQSQIAAQMSRALQRGQRNR